MFHSGMTLAQIRSLLPIYCQWLHNFQHLRRWSSPFFPCALRMLHLAKISILFISRTNRLLAIGLYRGAGVALSWPKTSKPMAVFVGQKQPLFCPQIRKRKLERNWWRWDGGFRRAKTANFCSLVVSGTETEESESVAVFVNGTYHQ